MWPACANSLVDAAPIYIWERRDVSETVDGEFFSPSAIDPTDEELTPGKFLCESQDAVIVNERLNCLLQHYGGGCMLSMNWGKLKLKPTHLQRLSPQTDEFATLPFRAQLFDVVDTGVTLYGDPEILKSAIVRWLVNTAKCLSDALARFPLLLTPVKEDLSLEGVTVVWKSKAETKNKKVKHLDAQDGQLEMSVELARKWRKLLDNNALRYVPFQFRGLIRIPEMGLALAKGMCVVNPKLTGLTLCVTESTVKVRVRIYGPNNFS